MDNFKKMSFEEKSTFFESLNQDFDYDENPLPLLKIENMVIQEYPESSIFWEGFIGDLNKKANLISGICIWDCRWKVVFERLSEKNSSYKEKVLSLTKSRIEAIDLIKKGRKINSFMLPKTLGLYHTENLKWFKKKITELNPKKIFFHLPTQEYHLYIREIEVAANKLFSEMHEHLDTYSKLISEDLRSFCQQENVELEFIDPYNQNGLEDVIESYKWPYMNLPIIYPNEEFIAIETLYEIKLVTNSLVKKCVFGIFGIKDYYLEKDNDDDNSMKLTIQ